MKQSFGSLLRSKRVPISAFGKKGSNTCYFLMNPSFHFNDGLVYWSPKNLWKGFFHPHNGNLISPSPTSLPTYPSMTSLLAHTVAQTTKRRFLPKNLSQLVIFVIELAFT